MIDGGFTIRFAFIKTYLTYYDLSKFWIYALSQTECFEYLGYVAEIISFDPALDSTLLPLDIFDSDISTLIHNDWVLEVDAFMG